MVAKFVRHKLTTGTGAGSMSWFFLAPKDSYKGIETETGVTDNLTTVEQDYPLCKVEELLGSSQAVRKILRVVLSSGKSKYKRILVSSDKADTVGKATADGGLAGKAGFGGTIKGIANKRDASFA